MPVAIHNSVAYYYSQLFALQCRADPEHAKAFRHIVVAKHLRRYEQSCFADIRHHKRRRTTANPSPIPMLNFPAFVAMLVVVTDAMQCRGMGLMRILPERGPVPIARHQEPLRHSTIGSQRPGSIQFGTVARCTYCDRLTDLDTRLSLWLSLHCLCMPRKFHMNVELIFVPFRTALHFRQCNLSITVRWCASPEEYRWMAAG